MKRKANNAIKLYLTALLPAGFILPVIMVWGLLIANIYKHPDDDYQISPSLVSALLAAIANIGIYGVIATIACFIYSKY